MAGTCTATAPATSASSWRARRTGLEYLCRHRASATSESGPATSSTATASTNFKAAPHTRCVLCPARDHFSCCRCPQQHICFVYKQHFLFVRVLDVLLLTAKGAGLMEVREDGWSRCVHQRQRQQVRAAPPPLPPPHASRYLGKYEGQFLNGCMDGSGVYVWAEGDV
jgi:hypothetical protein